MFNFWIERLCIVSLKLPSLLCPQCSRSCNGGYRVREVRCLTDSIMPSELCDPSLNPESREECNKQPCLAEISTSVVSKNHILCLKNRFSSPFFLTRFPFPLQIRRAATSTTTAWWWFKLDCASTRTTKGCAVPRAPVLRNHTQTRFKSNTSAGDAATPRLLSVKSLQRV